jgi:hypothetical protein
MHVSTPPSSNGHALPPPAWEILRAVRRNDPPDTDTLLGQLLRARLSEIPGARWASITYRRPPHDDPTTVGSSSDVARSIDEFQYALSDGPCLRASTGMVVRADATLMRVHWPDLTQRMVAETPARAVLSHPLLPDATFGALNVYAETSAGLPPSAVAAAADLAATCSLALSALLERTRAQNLTVALETSRLIGAAIGIVMAQTRCTYEEAFEAIRGVSQRLQRKMRDVAEEVVLTGALPGC